MVTYQSEAQAAADGFRIEHQAAAQRFALLRGAEQLGEAHYSLTDRGGEPTINFDHTYVAPKLRGSGLAALLAEHALADDIVLGRRITASCWYIREHLERHPRLREQQG